MAETEAPIDPDAPLRELAEYIASAMPNDIGEADVARGELTLRVRPSSLTRVLKFLKDDASCRFRQLMDLCGVDHPERDPRFDVVYHLLSLEHNQRVRVKTMVDDSTPVPSVIGLFPCAGWYEREAWDLFGILFSDNPDLRRLLTDYGFEGHPLRKDFPLTGHVELRYDEDEKRVVYRPVKLSQEFRRFDFESPWEGMDEVIRNTQSPEPRPRGGEA